MYIIDVNTTFGCQTEVPYDLTLNALQRELDTHHVAGALSLSLKGIHYDPAEGNRESIQLGTSHPHLFPVGTWDLREYYGWEDELEGCLINDVRAFRFFPEIQGWSLSSHFFQLILSRLSGSKVCLLFSAGALTTAGGHAEEIARQTAGAGLPVILIDTNYNNMAEVIVTARKYPHIFVETNWLAGTDAVEIMLEEIGAERVLFGSGAPQRPLQKALNQVLETTLSESDKRAILGENAMRLVGLTPADLTGRPQVEQYEPATFSEPIIDVHTHLGHWRMPAHDEGYDPRRMLTRMRSFGVTHSIVSSYEGMRYDIHSGNARLARAIEGHPELLGYVELNPHELELSCQEMDRYYKMPNFVGAELELIHTVHPTASQEVKALMAEVTKRGKPVLFMPAGSHDAPAERQLALDNPDLIIIHAHGMDANWARVIADAPNLYVEFNRSAPCHHEIRDCLDILGADRILFGSDQTLLSLGASVGLYLDAGLGRSERQKVLHENAKRAFGLENQPVVE